MLIFVSSTFRDLQDERAAVDSALRQGEAAPWGMECFNSQPQRPLDVCLNELRQCRAVVLIIGFHGGSLIPHMPDFTYTAAEVAEARKLGMRVFSFIKTEHGCWRNEEPAGPVRDALEDFKRMVLETCGTVSYFDSIDELKFKVLATILKWNEQGRPGSRKTFDSREAFFAPYQQPTETIRLFDFAQTLEGRARELGALNAFLADPQRKVALLSGRCGIGKTKLVHDWTAQLDGFQALFLRPGAIWHAQSDKEVPVGDLLIVADDAHHAGHITELLALTQTLAQSTARSVKLLISTRPSGIPGLRCSLARFFESAEIVELPPLEKLRLEDVRSLASQMLGLDHTGWREWLVSLSADTPLVTVIGGRLIARGKLQSAALANEAEFRQAVFDRFIDEYTTILPNDGFPWRKLINLMAAVCPTRARDESFLSSAEMFLDRPRHEIAQALDQLEAHGLLVRSDDRVRIAPDTLGDFLLEGACVNLQGEATGYAEAVFRALRSHDLPSLLNNLAELQWRLEQKNLSANVLSSIWDTIGIEFREADAAERIDILEALAGAAVFQPNPTLQIIRAAMDTDAKPAVLLGYWPQTQEHVLRKIAPLLRSLAYHGPHTEEAVRRLFILTRKLPGDALSGEPGKILRELASYQLYKPVAFLSQVAHIAAAIGREPDAFSGRVTPLDVADAILQKDICHQETTEFEFRIGSVELNYPLFASVRQKAFQIVAESLNAVEPQRSGQAIDSLSAVLSSAAPIIGRELSEQERKWQETEREQALEIIEARIRRTDTPMPLLRQIRNLLRQVHPEHHPERFLSRVQQVADAIPDSEELSSFDAFCTPDYDRRYNVDDLVESKRFAQLELEAAIESFASAHPSVDEQLAVLEHMAQQAEEYQIRTTESAYPFLELLCRNGDFTGAFIRYVLGDPHPQLGFQIRMLLPHFRVLDSRYYAEIGLACSVSHTGNVAWGAAHGICLGPQLEHPIPEDVAIMTKLAAHKELDVRRLAIEGLGRVGRTKSFQTEAASIIAGVDLAGNPHLATAACAAFSMPGIPVMALSRDQILSLLCQILPIDRIDEREHNIFFSAIGEQAPNLLLEFFLDRLKRFGQLLGGSRNGYRHWGNTPLRNFFANAHPPAGVADQLRKIRDFLTDDNVPKAWISELFWALGDADGAAQVVISEWQRSGDPEKSRLANYLLSHR